MAKKTGGYADGYVLVIPKKNLGEYKKMAREGERLWRKYGALGYAEYAGDDLKVKWGLPFPRLAKAKPNETVVFSYVTYKSRAHRDRVNAKVMADPAMNDQKYKDKAMPFDMKKMAYGGFKSIL